MTSFDLIIFWTVGLLSVSVLAVASSTATSVFSAPRFVTAIAPTQLITHPVAIRPAIYVSTGTYFLVMQTKQLCLRVQASTSTSVPLPSVDANRKEKILLDFIQTYSPEVTKPKAKFQSLHLRHEDLQKFGGSIINTGIAAPSDDEDKITYLEEAQWKKYRAGTPIKTSLTVYQTQLSPRFNDLTETANWTSTIGSAKVDFGESQVDPELLAEQIRSATEYFSKIIEEREPDRPGPSYLLLELLPEIAEIWYCGLLQQSVESVVKGMKNPVFEYLIIIFPSPYGNIGDQKAPSYREFVYKL